MGNITVAILGSLEYGSSLAKKGTSTDITLYNLKKGEDTVTIIEPTRYPERLAPLFYACSLAKKAIVSVNEMNSTFGEQLVMLQCSDIKSGYIILKNYVPKEKIEAIIKGTTLEKFEIIPDDPNALREKLLLEASQQKPTGLSAGHTAIGAVPGDRVGLALKNVEVEDLDRGAVLTNDPSIKTSTVIKTQASLVKYWQTPIKT